MSHKSIANFEMVESIIPETRVLAIASHVGLACPVSTVNMTDTLCPRSFMGEYREPG